MKTTLAGVLLAAALGLLAVQAQADEKQAQTQAPKGARPFQGEQLLFDVPPGWRVAQERTMQQGDKRSRIVVMAPLQHAPGVGSEQLAAMTLIHDRTPPLKYLQAVDAQAGQLCGRQVVTPGESDASNGYVSQVEHRYCEKDKRDGLCRSFMTKAMGGTESLFVVGYIKAYSCAATEQFSAEEARHWADYFSSVSICDQRRDNCPADGKPVPQMST
jgi:hypothetical protein